MTSFDSELRELIEKWREAGANLPDMVEDLELAAEQLVEEINGQLP